MNPNLHLPPPGLPRIPRYTGVAEHLVDSLAQLNPLSVLRGPRGFGKTSLLVTWLRRGTELPETLYLRLTQEAGDPAGFWDQLRRGLAHVDPGLSEQDDPAGSQVPELPEAELKRVVVTWLSRRQSPLLLLIDDYHEAGLREGAAGIDDALVDLIRQNDQLYLVVAGRTMRGLETIGSLSVETLVIGPEDLQLTPPMVEALAGHMGVAMSGERAQHVASDLGGWPSAIRAGMHRAATGPYDGSGEVTLADEYIGAMVQDLRFEKVRTFLLRTAIPDELDVETARVIAPEGNTVRMLRNIRAAGLLRESAARSGTYYYPRAIRSALRSVMRETRPEVEHEVYQELMRFAVGRNDPAQALVYATKGHLWGLALDLLDSHWAGLVSTNPQTLGEVASSFPPQMIAENPRLAVAVRYFSEIRTQAGAPLWAGADATSLDTAIAGHRSLQADTGRDELLVLMQWGAGSLLSGNLDMAMYAFSQARSFALVHQEGAESYLGVAGIALVHALQGEVDLCLDWLEESRLTQWLSENKRGRTSDPMVLLALAARALAQVDGARPEAGAAIMSLVEPEARDELWALCVFIRARHALAGRETAEIVRQTSIVRTARRHIRPGSLMDAFLSTALVECLVSTGMTLVADEIVQKMQPRGFTWIAVARLRLSQERYDEAVSAAEEALRSSGESGRYALDAHAVLAAAHYGAGRAERARRAFQAAVTRAFQTGQRYSLTLMRRHVFIALAMGDESILGLWTHPASGSERPPGEAGLTVALTVREAQVFYALEQQSGPVGIAQALDLSVNTAKTHLRSVYRKLGVSSRNEALEKLGHVLARN